VSKRQQITDDLRDLVVREVLPPGTRLPTTSELARQWNVPPATIQQALIPLVKEGLLLRRPRLGTFVREREARLHGVGLYIPASYCLEGNAGYTKALLAALRDQFADRHLACTSFIDHRPDAEQGQPWPELVAAVESQRIQGLIVPIVDELRLTWLHKLPVPAAFGGTSRIPNIVYHDHGQLADAGLRQLAAQGCRSVGVISVTPRGNYDAAGAPHEYQVFYLQLARSAADLGLELREEWIKTPPLTTYVGELEAEQFGYASVRTLWQERARPAGLLVFTDVAARGVLMGLLELQVQIPADLKLVLHRNAEVGLLCPFPATFLEASVKATAAALVDLVWRQYRGDAVTPIRVPFTVVPPSP